MHGKKRLNWESSLCTIKMECFISMDQPGLNNAGNIEPGLKDGLLRGTREYNLFTTSGDVNILRFGKE
jgi:hypothetical protein